jgi:Protein of unknown function (DUF3152)
MLVVALVALVAALWPAPAGEGRAVASAEAEPAAVPQPAPQPNVASRGNGRLRVVPGSSTRSGPGPVRRYAVEIEGGIEIKRRVFANRVHDILRHHRSWGGTDRVSFRRVSRGRIDFRVTLATPATTDRLCAPYITGGIYSCANGGRAVLNLMRWRNGAAAYRHVRRYRIYLVNHEVGHLLGHGHRYCPAAGARAPVMMQQTKGVGSCRPNPWPLRYERG